MLVAYETEDGRIPFQKWFDGLDSIAATKVYVSLTRLEAGNTSNLKSVGEGVLEQRIDFGPGYRLPWEGWRHADHPARWRHQAAATAGYFRRH